MASPLTGQVAVTGTAQPLDLANRSVNCVAFAFKTPSTNTHTVYIGSAGVTTANGYPLTPGDEFEYQRLFNQITPTLQCTPADFYAIGTAGSDVLAWFATP